MALFQLIFLRLEAIAESDTEDECSYALQTLYESSIMQNDRKLFLWFERKWLRAHKVCISLVFLESLGNRSLSLGVNAHLRTICSG